MKNTLLNNKIHIIKGSPQTIVYYPNPKECIIIDPGYQEKRAKQIKKQYLENCEKTTIILTHYHADHTKATPILAKKDTEIIISNKDYSMLQDPILTNHLTYNYPFYPNDETPMIKPIPIKPTKTITPPQKTDNITMIPLPGHTLGQTAVIIEDQAIYTADSFFGDKILDTYKIPYHHILPMATDTLIQKQEEITQYTIIPSHGPILNEKQGQELIHKNIQRNKEIIDTITTELHKPRTIHELVKTLHKKYDYKPTIFSLLLTENTVKGIITTLKNNNLIEPIIHNNAITWKIK